MVLLVALLLAAAAEAPPARPPKDALVYTSLTGARYNGLGLVSQFRVSWRHRLFDSDNLLLRDSYLGLGPIVAVTPAFARGGLMVDFFPLAILQLTAAYEAIGYFGVLDGLLSFVDANAEHGDEERRRLGRLGTANYATYGGQLTLSALLQAKLGPIAVRNQVQGFFTHMQVRSGDRVYYDAIPDVLVPARGWIVSNDLDVLFVTKGGLIAGVRYSLLHAFYGSVESNNTPIQRFGVLLGYQFFDRPDAKLNKPTLFVLSQWYLAHRYRTGQEVSQAIPQLIVGFAFQGIFAKSNPPQL